MKNKLITTITCILTISLLSGCSALKNEHVPDENTAISIAVAAWIPIYGKEKIESQKPYKATLSNGVWHVNGTLSQPEPEQGSRPKIRLGGTAYAEIAQSDGAILKTTHFK